MSGHEGKKIDEISVGWNVNMVVRYHAGRHPTFTVVAGDESYHGHDLGLLLERGRIHLNGWDKLVWSPVIAVDTEVSYDLSFTYRRCFQSKHKGKAVFRAWKIQTENEVSFDRYDRPKTGDVLTGEPGEDLSRVNGRILPFTAERWMQFRRLSKALKDAMSAAEEKLSKILAGADLDKFLSNVSESAPMISFSNEKGRP